MGYFVSPEHIDQSLALTRELRQLPNGFLQKVDELQVR